MASHGCSSWVYFKSARAGLHLVACGICSVAADTTGLRSVHLTPPKVRPRKTPQSERAGEDMADAHHKRQVMGREVVVPIPQGRLHVGSWEHIFYYEFDGRRRKRLLVKITGQ